MKHGPNADAKQGKRACSQRSLSISHSCALEYNSTMAQDYARALCQYSREGATPLFGVAHCLLHYAGKTIRGMHNSILATSYQTRTHIVPEQPGCRAIVRCVCVVETLCKSVISLTFMAVRCCARRPLFSINYSVITSNLESILLFITSSLHTHTPHITLTCTYYHTLRKAGA